MSEHTPHPEPHPDLAGYVLGVLAVEEADAFEDHLAACDRCRREVSELAPLPSLLDGMAPPVEVPADLRTRALSRIHQAAQKDARRAARRRLAGVAAAVLVLLVTAGIVVGTRLDGSSGGGASIPLAAAAGGGASGVAVVEPAPGGVGVALEVRGLAPSRPGTWYECWWVSASDPPAWVSAGTFVVGSDGTGDVRMTTAFGGPEWKVVVTEREPGPPPPDAPYGRPVLVSR